MSFSSEQVQLVEVFFVSKTVAQAIATCDFAATAVGYGNLAAVGPVLAQGIRKRGKSAPRLNVLVCENGIGAKDELSLATLGALPFSLATVNHDHNEPVRFIQSVVDRMVPPQKSEQLMVTTEPYGRLSYSTQHAYGPGWLGPIQPPDSLIPFCFLDWNHAENQKLFLHNGGHFLIVSLGPKQGYTTIAEALAAPKILHELLGFWDEANAGIQSAFQDWRRQKPYCHSEQLTPCRQNRPKRSRGRLPRNPCTALAKLLLPRPIHVRDISAQRIASTVG